MATPNWLASTEQVIGASHPLFANSKDRVGQTIQAMLEISHSTNGVHDARTTGLIGEIDTFTGNGANRTITMSNANLTPKKVYVWEGKRTANLVTNGGFETDITGWTFNGDGSATGGTAGGQSGNCVAIANAGTAFDYIQQTVTGLVVGRSYQFLFYEKSGTITGAAFYQLQGAAAFGPSNFTSSATWTQRGWSFTAATTSLIIVLANNENVLNGTILFDTVELYETGGNDATRIDLMTSDKAQPFRYKTTAWAADLIDNETAGSFDVGDDYVNTSGETNYYHVWGYDDTTVPVGDPGAGSDPTWIESSVLNRIIADDSAVVSSDNVANSVESEIWTLFLEEHDENGAHTVDVQHARIETISWAGNNADDRVISLDIDDLAIDYIEVYRNGLVVSTKSSDMAGDTTKLEATAAFSANYVQDITTAGQVTVGTALNESGQTYIAFVVGV